MQNFIALMRRRWGESRQELMYCRHGRGGLRKRHPGHRARAKATHAAIRAVDIKPLHDWYQLLDDVENLCIDLNLRKTAEAVTRGAHGSLQLAANMGGDGLSLNITRP